MCWRLCLKCSETDLQASLIPKFSGSPLNRGRGQRGKESGRLRHCYIGGMDAPVHLFQICCGSDQYLQNYKLWKSCLVFGLYRGIILYPVFIDEGLFGENVQFWIDLRSYKSQICAPLKRRSMGHTEAYTICSCKYSGTTMRSRAAAPSSSFRNILYEGETESRKSDRTGRQSVKLASAAGCGRDQRVNIETRLDVWLYCVLPVDWRHRPPSGPDRRCPLSLDLPVPSSGSMFCILLTTANTVS